MKAILILDEMPKSCMECDYCNEFGICKYVGNVGEAFERGLRYIKCPLKPMPEKQIIDIETTNDNVHYYAIGFNDCIDAIVGEEENE